MMENKGIDLNRLQKITTDLGKEIEQVSTNPDITHDTPILDVIKFILDNIKSIAAILDKNHTLIYFNKAARMRVKKIHGRKLKIGMKCYESIFGLDNVCADCKVFDAIKTKKMQVNVWHSDKTNRDYYQTCIPLKINGVAGVIEILEEKTDGIK